MRFDVITLFPDLFAPFLGLGVNRRAFGETGGVDVRVWNLRDHADGAYRRVDDRPFGGGPGMVLMPEPLARCLAAVRQDRAGSPTGAAPVLLFSPAGRRMDQAMVQRWADSAGAILVCGRYEGVDQRFIDRFVDEQISLGDFVLSGGEIAALALLDAVARLQPGVLGDPDSHQQDSFSPQQDGLLDCPHYTRPQLWSDGERCWPVPQVLTSGDHARVARFRREQSLALTARCRPDLLERARAAGRLDARDEAHLRQLESLSSPSGRDPQEVCRADSSRD